MPVYPTKSTKSNYEASILVYSHLLTDLRGTKHFRSAQDFRDPFLLRCGQSPGDLPSHCDGCGQKFSVQHALEFKKGGNAILRHSEIRHELANLAAKAIIPSEIRNEPLIHSSCPAVKMPELVPAHPAVTRN
jgi:hypothetical protein